MHIILVKMLLFLLSRPLALGKFQKKKIGKFLKNKLLVEWMN
jgi:hypothetical protein